MGIRPELWCASKWRACFEDDMQFCLDSMLRKKGADHSAHRRQSGSAIVREVFVVRKVGSSQNDPRGLLFGPLDIKRFVPGLNRLFVRI